MKASFKDVQRAFISGSITLEQLIEVLIDNFGERKTRQILKNNIKIALEKENSISLEEDLKKILE